MRSRDLFSVYSELGNERSRLGGEPNYSERINVPRDAQDADLYTELYWAFRWELECVAPRDYLFIPVWNTLSERDFDNQDFEQLLLAAETYVMNFDVDERNLEKNVVHPFLEMDMGKMWTSIDIEQARDIIDGRDEGRIVKAKRSGDDLSNELDNLNRRGRGRGQDRGGWGSQSTGRRGGRNTSFATSRGRGQDRGQDRGKRSGMFRRRGDDRHSSQTSSGARTTTSSGATVLGKQTEDRKPASSAPRFATRSAVREDRKSREQTTSAFDDMLPSTEFKPKGNVTIDRHQDNVREETMAHDVRVEPNPTTGSSMDEITCPILRAVLENAYGNELPSCSLVMHQGSAIGIPSSENRITFNKQGNGDDTNIARGGNMVLFDVMFFSNKDEAVLGDTVFIDKNDLQDNGSNMDYLNHTLSGAVKPVNAKTHVNPAVLIVNPNEKNDEGLVTKLSSEIDKADAVYVPALHIDELAAVVQAQSSESDRAVETYQNIVMPFTLTDAQWEIVTELRSPDLPYVTKIEKIKLLPTEVSGWIAAKVVDDVLYALKSKLGVDLTIEGLDDVPDLPDFLAGSRGTETKDAWLGMVNKVINKSVCVVPDDQREAAIASLGEAVSADDPNLRLFVRNEYVLRLPYCLAELEISTESKESFLVVDTHNTNLHEAVNAVFGRLEQTDVDDLRIVLLDGITYRVTKSDLASKCYSFVKV